MNPRGFYHLCISGLRLLLFLLQLSPLFPSFLRPFCYFFTSLVWVWISTPCILECITPLLSSATHLSSYSVFCPFWSGLSRKPGDGKCHSTEGIQGSMPFIRWKANRADDKKPKSYEIWINGTNGAGAETLGIWTVWILSNMPT